MRAKQADKSAFIERDGVKVHYEVYGNGPATLLFLPAWAIGYSRIWKMQLPYFSRFYRCIAFDPRGNGRSDRPDTVSAYRLEDYIGDALAILEAEKITQTVVIGMSFGGVLASVLAAYHPAKIQAAIAISSSFQIGPAITAREHFDQHYEQPQGWQKFNRYYWHQDYRGFVEFFMGQIFPEPHSTKPIEDGIAWGLETGPAVLENTILARMQPSSYDLGPALFQRIQCPLLLIHGEQDGFMPAAKSQLAAELSGAELVLLPQAGHVPMVRFPAKVNALIKDFLDRHNPPSPAKPTKTRRDRQRALYLSSPIGLGHARRDLAIARALRQLRPDLHIDWLAQDPVTRFLQNQQERIHPASHLLVNESQHIESEAGEHDLHAFQALRRMDEILIANFMLFQEVLEQDHYDLVIADEAWDVDHFWHEHPEFKRAPMAWLTDFVGFVPMPQGGEHEAYLTCDYNAEMIQHIERSPQLRDRALFIGNPEDIIPSTFGSDLPLIRDWVGEHFDFCGYVLGQHPDDFGSREELRQRFGYRQGEKVCLVSVGGSGVGKALIQRILHAYPTVKTRIPELRLIVIIGPRLDANLWQVPQGVDIETFVPDLDQRLAACNLALVQGGLTTCMELTAAGTPFIYFPLHNHFEQQFHVHHRLQQYRAGLRMDYATATPDALAETMLQVLHQPVDYRPVEAHGAQRAARMLAELL